jgi:tetratricopeptide (TPR) repeat protein
MAGEDNRDEMKSAQAGKRERQWLFSIGTALALLAAIISFLSDSVDVLQFLRGDVATPVPIEELASKIVLERLITNTSTPEATALPTPTATTVVTPPATPLPVMAAADERLLIVAQFTNFTVDANYNVAGRIQEELAAQVAAARLEDTSVVVWPDEVADNLTAIQVLQATHATLVIWGEYDSGRVRVRFTLADSGKEMDWQRYLGAPTELVTTINLDVPRETQALALMTLGRLYRNGGDLKRARAAFAQALAQHPSDQDTVATLTFYLAALDAGAEPANLDRAIAGYTTVIELRPDWFNARYNRGLAYLTRYWQVAEKIDLDRAIDDFSWTLDVKNNYTEALINRSIAFYARNGEGDLDAAINDLTAAIRYSPNSYRAYYNRGLTYIRLNQQEAWINDLAKALVIEPSFAAAHHALCWGYALDQLPDKGIVHCDAAVESNDSGSTLDGRGLVLAELGKLDEAAGDLEKYLAWLDTQPEVWSQINNRKIYEDLIVGLQSGENPVTPEILARLR